MGARGPKPADTKDRLLARIRVNLFGCWEWQGARGSQTGHGKVGMKVRSTGAADNYGWRSQWAHRVSYETFVGPIPEGLHLDHLCRNPCCINPRHLEPVTHAENQRRARRTHCQRGHAMTDENVYAPDSKHRTCRTCQRSRNAARVF